MRRPIFRMEREQAVEFLRRAPVIHMASTNPDGTPVFRTLHGVVVDNFLVFHGGPVGEKVSCLGREAVFSAEEIVAELPSYFFDAERACPATTYYESVQVHGVVEEVSDLAEKASLMQALMERFQPEGQYRAISSDDPMYHKAVKSLLVARVSLERVVGKSKMGQHKKPEIRKKILEQLWERGREQDLAAIPRILQANPDTPAPDFLRGPEGCRLSYQLSSADMQVASQMLLAGYWNEGFTQQQILEALLGSDVVVGAYEVQTGTLVGVCRAVSDGSKHAWIYDVMVQPTWRGCGVGGAMLTLLLQHPRLRNVRYTHLSTQDAQPFYRLLGFVENAELSPRAWRSYRMIRFPSWSHR